MVLYGMVGLLLHGRYGMVVCGMYGIGIMWCGMVIYVVGMVWYDMVGMVWYGIGGGKREGEGEGEGEGEHVLGKSCTYAGFALRASPPRQK